MAQRVQRQPLARGRDSGALQGCAEVFADVAVVDAAAVRAHEPGRPRGLVSRGAAGQRGLTAVTWWDVTRSPARPGVGS